MCWGALGARGCHAQWGVLGVVCAGAHRAQWRAQGGTRSHAGFPGGSDGTEAAGKCRRPGIAPWVRTIPWRRAWQPTPVFLLGEFLGQRSLAGYSPWGWKGSDTTE